ncbi:PhzF family phenazine biosynthesis protein [Microbacterium immunditiarum]|uniref:Putative PhzF superfamily epimerase YddE/YHI9 n=1 Tax=Microbacterium immunditiarum TaxID=337480 RepID=A0A7Y9KJT4_9MICO|nr:putative PhzF superfamily epimerase YddE/YHI9 [Microbacterium immunditiarum]
MGLFADVVNVFVDSRGQHGNPLGIIWSSDSTRGQEQQIASDLGFSETIFIDDFADGECRARIFTPTRELAFAGHPTVGLAAWLRGSGDDIRTIVVPAGTVRVRAEGDLVFVTAAPEWGPVFDFEQLESPRDVEAVDPAAYGGGIYYVWAWIDERAGHLRARMFGPAIGIPEDEATGAAAIRLAGMLGRDLEITQGHGSQLFTRVVDDGRLVEVGGRTADVGSIEIR